MTVFQRLQEDSRLRTYALLKTCPGFEKYLDNIIPSLRNRTALTKLRLSDHKLMIEKGRHTNPKSDKSLCFFCPFCPNQVDDNEHILIRCQTYRHIRHDLYDDVKKTSPSHSLVLETIMLYKPRP